MGEALAGYLQTVGIRTKVRTMERAALTTAWRDRKIKNVIHDQSELRRPLDRRRLPRQNAGGKLLRQCHFRGIVRTMKAVIDRAGRIVVPKPLRQALGLTPGQLLEIRAGDGRLEIEIASTPMMLKKRGKGLVAVPEAKLPPLTAEQVRDTLERVRR